MQAAYDAGGGVVYFPIRTKGKYLVKGAIKTNDGNGHTVNKAQLYIPYTGYTNIQNAPTIILKSDIPPVPYSDWTSNQNEDIAGAWIISTLADSGCVIGSAYSSGTWGNWNYTQAFIENLGIQTRSIADDGTDTVNTMSAVDFYYNTMNGGHDVKFKTQSFPGRSVQPKAGCYGLRLPANNNFNATNWQNVFVQGFATGVQVSENAHIVNLNINTCDTGLNIISGYHAINIGRAIIQWCRTNVLISGTAYFNINQLDLESYMGSMTYGLQDKWFNNIADIKEKYLTNSRGNIKYHYVRSYMPIINEYNINNTILSLTIKASPIGTDGSTGSNGYVQLRYDSGFYSTPNLYFDRTFSKLGVQNTSPPSALTISLPNAGVGTISHLADTTVTGVGTDFLNTFDVGDNITDAAQSRLITAIQSNTSLTTSAWANTASNMSYSYTKADNLQLRSSGSIFTAGNKRLLYYKLFDAALGVDAMRSVITASNNAALGYNALYSLTTGNNNVGIGYKAGWATTIGTGNNFIGYNAGVANTTGINNIAIGQAAFVSNITGNNNVGIGYSALNLSTANNLTAVGYFALSNNSTGIENTAFGYQALKANTTGHRNIAIGANADVATNNQTNSIAIGYGAISYASNTTTIGNNSTTDTRINGKINVAAFNEVTNQTTSQTIASYTTGVNDSTFNISGRLTVTSACDASVKLSVTYTDETNNVRLIDFFNMGATVAALSAKGVSSFPILGEVRVKAGKTITVSTSVAGVPTYNAGVTIIKIR